MIPFLRSSCIFTLIVSFIGSSLYIPPANAQEINLPPLPQPGVMVHLSPVFTPASLKGIVIHPENALKFDFIVYKGDRELNEAQKKEEYTKLAKYFLASLAIPDDDQWVNLSPYEKDRIIRDDFGKTEMGRDLLAQDYILKQITASLIYPEDNLGKKFWDRVYSQAREQYGTSNIPVNTFNKVWIVPDDADIYEKGNTAFVFRSHLKVMMEEDYLSLRKHSGIQSVPMDTRTHSVASKIVKEIILPELEKEVNEGANFASLRQVFSGMVLAAWYKRALKESLLSKIYADKSKVKGVDQDPRTNEKIYQQYLRAYKKGVFNYIKEDIDKYTNETIPRKYFSGGFDTDHWKALHDFPESSEPAMIATDREIGTLGSNNIDQVTIQADEIAAVRARSLQRGAGNITSRIFDLSKQIKALERIVDTQRRQYRDLSAFFLRVNNSTNLAQDAKNETLDKTREQMAQTDERIKGYNVQLRGLESRLSVLQKGSDDAMTAWPAAEKLSSTIATLTTKVRALWDAQQVKPATALPSKTEEDLNTLLIDLQGLQDHLTQAVNRANSQIGVSGNAIKEDLITTPQQIEQEVVPELNRQIDEIQGALDSFRGELNRFGISDPAMMTRVKTFLGISTMLAAMGLGVLLIHHQNVEKERIANLVNLVLPADLQALDLNDERTFLTHFLSTQPAKDVDELQTVTSNSYYIGSARDQQDYIELFGRIGRQWSEGINISLDEVLTRDELNILEASMTKYGSVSNFYKPIGNPVDYMANRLVEGAPRIDILQAVAKDPRHPLNKYAQRILDGLGGEENITALDKAHQMLTDAVNNKTGVASIAGQLDIFLSSTGISKNSWAIELLTRYVEHAVYREELQSRGVSGVQLERADAELVKITYEQPESGFDIRKIDDKETGITLFGQIETPLRIGELPVKEQVGILQDLFDQKIVHDSGFASEYGISSVPVGLITPAQVDREKILKQYRSEIAPTAVQPTFKSEGKVTIIESNAQKILILTQDLTSLNPDLGLDRSVLQRVINQPGLLPPGESRNQLEAKLNQANQNTGSPSLNDEERTIADSLNAGRGVVNIKDGKVIVTVVPRVQSSTTRPATSQPATGVDQAMLKGGIDLNAFNLNLRIKRDGAGVPLPLAQQDMAQINQIDGLVPVILDIEPAAASATLSELTAAPTS